MKHSTIKTIVQVAFAITIAWLFSHFFIGDSVEKLAFYAIYAYMLHLLKK